MPWLINPAGSEVFVDKETLAKIEQRGDRHLFRERPWKYAGLGPTMKIAVVYQAPNGSNGIGDYVHAMPALCAKVAAGFDVHVYSSEFFRPFIERSGATYHDCKAMGIGWLADAQKIYGTVYMLTFWCIKHDELTFGDVTKDRFAQMADYLETTLPETFSWKERLLR